jgi:hypothetical protein
MSHRISRDPLALALAADDPETRLDAFNLISSRARRSAEPDAVVRPFGYKNFDEFLEARRVLATRVRNARYQSGLVARGQRLVTVPAPVSATDQIRDYSNWLSERERACE